MKNITFLILLASISFAVSANPGRFQLNQACMDVGCFSGDDPSTTTIEINKAGGTFVLTGDIFVNSTSLNGQPLISINAALGETAVVIDLNGYRIQFRGTPSSGTYGILVAGGEAVVTIKNGTIFGFEDGIRTSLDSTLLIENMVFQENTDDAVQAGVAVIKNSVFDNNRYGVNALSAGSGLLGDRIVLDGNLFIDNDEDQDIVFGMLNTNVCKDNVVAYPLAAGNDFDSCTLVGFNQCNDTACTVNRSSESSADKE